MAKRQSQGGLSIGTGANHAMAPVPSTLKRAGEEALPSLCLAKRKVLLTGIRNASPAIKISRGFAILESEQAPVIAEITCDNCHSIHSPAGKRITSKLKNLISVSPVIRTSGLKPISSRIIRSKRERSRLKCSSCHNTMGTSYTWQGNDQSRFRKRALL